MPALNSSVSINDGQATPVAHSFIPVKVSPDETILQERSSSTPLGYKTLSVRFSPASAKRNTYRANVKLVSPIVETVGGVNVITGSFITDCSFVVPNNSTVQQRKDQLAYFLNSLLNYPIGNVITDIEAIW